MRRGYETSMAEKLAHDVEWIADRSVRLYLRTLVATAWRVLAQTFRVQSLDVESRVLEIEIPLEALHDLLGDAALVS